MSTDAGIDDEKLVNSNERCKMEEVQLCSEDHNHN